jgi:hypothetical protein
MAFMIFDRKDVNGKSVLCATQESFSLAGYNLLHAAWTKLGSPIERGWHVTADELVQLHFEGEQNSKTKRLVVDFDPNTKRRIGLIELLDIYAFTWGDGSQGPEWTPLMLRFRDLFYEEYDPYVDETRKAEILSCIPEPESSTPDFVEFLYLNGPKHGWNWGMNGMTNAAFLHGGAREYFRQFF